MARAKRLLSLDPAVDALLADQDNASEYVSELVLAAERAGLALALDDDEAADMRDAARDGGLSLQEWARLVLRHASGRYELGEQLERAAETGSTLLRAAIGREIARPRKRAKR